MSRLTALIVVSFLLALPVLADASASLTGPTGLLLVPTADVLGIGQFNVGASSFINDEADETVIYGNVGLFPRLEIGIARDKFQGAEAETLLNAKLRVLGPLPGRISIAAGMNDFTDEIERTGYLVLTHTVGAGLIPTGPVTPPQIHVGVGDGRLDGLFAGVSTVVAGRVGVMAEYDGNNVNIGARMTVLPKLEATVAAMHDLDDFAVGASFTSPW